MTNENIRGSLKVTSKGKLKNGRLALYGHVMRRVVINNVTRKNILIVVNGRTEGNEPQKRG